MIALPADRLRPVQRPRSLASEVAAQLETLIMDGTHPPGARLASERALAERFAVSRTVVREAVHQLVTRGLLQVRSGAGTFVRQPDHTHAASALETLLTRGGHAAREGAAVYEARRPLEIEIAALAAVRAQPEHLAALRAHARVLDDPATTAEGLVEADMAFHMTLANATGNPVFVAILAAFASVLRALRLLHARDPENRRLVREQHQDILRAVAARDVDAARAAMTAHMDAAAAVYDRVATAMGAVPPDRP